MKTMTCYQLGGACEMQFSAETFDEIAVMSKKHGREMFQQQDKAHLAAMSKMKSLMQSPGAMQDWFENKRKQFEQMEND